MFDSDFEQELFKLRKKKLQEIVKLGQAAYPNQFPFTHTIPQVREKWDSATGEELEATRTTVAVAGRIVAIRLMGKAGFATLQQDGQRLQVYVRLDAVGEQGWALYKLLDLGDHIGVAGYLFRTRTGELSVHAERLTFLAKAMISLPEKYHGLADVELRYRQRYVDLFTNLDSREVFVKRAKVLRALRTFFDNRGYLEVETPMMQQIAGGAAARPFITHHNALDIDLYLRIALELHLKRLLVGGMERVYEIGRVFRNEGISPRHNPEFTMLELYQAYGDYRSMMDITEGMVVACVRAIGDKMQLPYGERTIDYSPPWPRIAYAELFAKHVGVPLVDTEAVRKIAADNGIATAGKHPDVIVHQLFEHRVEPVLTAENRPTFVYDYPAALCPLTKRKRDNPALAERFELYVHGMELANAYTELNDPVMQEATFRTQLAGLPEEDSMAKMDDDFVRALKHGMPPAGGMGIGIDRLVMLLTDTTTIRDVILFPLLRGGSSRQ